MASRTSDEENFAQNGADVDGGAFEMVIQGLPQLQEDLRLQHWEVERTVQEALRVQQRAIEYEVQGALQLQQSVVDDEVRKVLRLQEQGVANALSEMERELREKNEVIRDLQQRLEKAQARVAAMEKRTALEGCEWEDLQLTEGGRAQKMGTSPQCKTQHVPPRDGSVSRQLAKLQSAHVSSSATSAREAPVTGRGTAGGGEGSLQPEAAPIPSTSGAGHRGPADKEEEEARRRVEQLVEEVKTRMEEALNPPCVLGEMLFSAIGQGTITDIRRLVDCGADINYPDRMGCTPLFTAVSSGVHTDVVSFILQRGADVKAVSLSGVSALHHAAGRDSTGRCVVLLLGCGADVNARNKDGETPLHWAAEHGNEKAVRALLVAGARKDLKPWGGRWRNKIPFHIAQTPAIWDLLRM